jgi:iron complex outermembrane recepter protein
MEKFFRCVTAIVIVVSCASIAYADGGPLAQVTLKVSGLVIDSATREPVIGASVVLEPLSTGRRVGREGRFEFTGVRPGQYALHVRAIGYNDRHVELDLKGDVQLTITLAVKPISGEEIIVRPETPVTPHGITNKMSEDDLDRDRGQTLGETLEHISGVTTLQTGASIAKPVIRGLHSQRITVLNAGVAQEGQQWGAEHGPEIDPFAPTNIEVVKGAASVEYGAGAIGGVIRVVPRELPTDSIFRGNISLNAFSNNLQGAASAMLEGTVRGVSGFGWRGQISSRTAGDSRTPDYVLGNTAFKELNGSLALGYAAKEYGFEAFLSHFGSEIGIFKGSHIGSKSDLERVIAQGRPSVDYEFGYEIDAPKQSVDHELVSLGGHVVLSSLGKFEAHYGLQHNDRSEFETNRDPSKPDRRSMRLQLLTHSFDVKLQHKPIGNMTGSFGINGLRQGNTGDGYDLLIPNYLTFAGGIFALEQLGLGKDLTLKLGARFDHNSMSVYALPPKEIERNDHIYSSASGAFGAIYDLGRNWSINANLATAWRPPSINELYSNGVHHGSAQYERGDNTLTSERSINTELALRLQTPHIGLELTGFVNNFDGFINLVPQPEPVLTVGGTYPSFKYQQSDARFLGGELTVNYQLAEELSTRLTASVVRAKDVKRDESLFGIPADRAELEIEYLLPDWLDAFQSSSIALNTLAVARQDNAPAGDYAAPPAGYMLLNGRLSTHAILFGQQLNIFLEAHNILGQRYRDYLSRYRYFADDPGRNFILRISLPFGDKQ